MTTTPVSARPVAAGEPVAGGGGPPRRRGRAIVLCVVLLGVLITATFAVRVYHKPGVYWSEVKVLFLTPSSTQFPNRLAVTSGALITVAGAVGQMVDPRSSTARVVNPDVKLVNEGIRDGYSVTLPNDGGQWANNFDQSLLDVQVVGPSVQEVGGRMAALIQKINASLAALQRDANVQAVNEIHTSLSPAQPQIYYADGRRSRAVAATLLIGLALTTFAAAFARRRFVTATQSGQGVS